MVQVIPLPSRSKQRLRTFALLATALLISPDLPAAGVSPATGPVASGLTEADRAFRALDYELADSLYTALRQAEPDNADLWWKLARLNITIAESFSPKETARRMPYYTKAVDYARKAVTLETSNASAHTWLAAALAVKSDKLGNKEKLARAAEIKSELDRALALNPNDDVAWSILGSWYHQVSNIGWMNRFLGNTFVGTMPKGKPEDAERAFRKAISLNPRAVRHYHELALLLIDLQREGEALQILQAAMNKPVLMKSDLRRKEEMRKLIRKLEK